MDNTNTMAPEAVNEQAAGESNNNVQKLDKGKYVLCREDFSRGITEGLGFWYKEYKSLPDAVEHLDSLNKQSDLNGEKIVLGLLNNAIKGNLRGRANSKVPSGEDEKGNVDKDLRKAQIAALITSGKNVLIDEVTAENYVPGTREKTSIPSLWKEFNGLKEEAAKAKALGKMEEYEELKAEAKEIHARITALMAAEENLDLL
jgi:hypothetical protein